MRKIELAPIDRTMLEEAERNHHKAHVRNRCKAILMSDQGFKVKEIAHCFSVRTRTIYDWMNKWESKGYLGLIIQPGRGKAPTLDLGNKETVGHIKKDLDQ